MSDGQWSPNAGTGQIVVSGLTKQYKNVRAVDNLSFTVQPGRVTGFLGPNGAGKTTTLRMLLNLVTPTAGAATIGGRRYADLTDPLRSVGAVLEASSAHKGRTGINHLRVICAAAGLPRQRADEALALVGLTPAAKRKFKGYSLGMKQRLGIAAAMLGNPQVLILDEPANGLDPEGIRWMRGFLKGLAAEGRTVLVSSHLLSEMQLLADDVVIIAAGRLVRQGPVDQVIGSMAHGGGRVRVRTPQADELAGALREQSATVTADGQGALLVTGVDAPTVGRVALAAKVELHELTTERPDLEGVFLELTAGKAEIR
jgi:ABC-2 type transport system ATP-binding protein